MTLTKREIEVLTRLAEGARPGKVAIDMNLSVKTISTFRMRALAKLGIKSAADLQAIAYRIVLSSLQGAPT